MINDVRSKKRKDGRKEAGKSKRLKDKRPGSFA